MIEIWRDVKGYEGKYQVSSEGRVKSLDRKVVCKNGIIIPKKGSILKGFNINNYVIHSFDNRHHREHVLVAMAFPEICGVWYKGCHVHHIDHNPLNNRADNLIVISASEHSKLHYKTQPETFRKPSEKRSKSISIALKGRRRVDKHIPVDCFTKDGQHVRRYECISDVAKEGYSPGNVCYCCKGKIKTAYGFIWRYAA